MNDKRLEEIQKNKKHLASKKSDYLKREMEESQNDSTYISVLFVGDKFSNISKGLIIALNDIYIHAFV